MNSQIPAPIPNVNRFKPLTTPCEWIEHYLPGGFHPVHLGDKFHNDQYRVIRKLGAGSFSTVWLVFDSSHSRYAALKILKAEASNRPNELDILQYLHQNVSASQLQYVTSLWDNFEHRGPNGLHLCLVFEPMGPSVNSMIHELPLFGPRKAGAKMRYPMWMVKRILRQALKGLEYLHTRNITHGDFQPGNILFTLKDICHVSEYEIGQDENYKWGSISPPVERLDGKKDEWAPEYLVVPQPLNKYANIDRDFEVKLSDLGGAFFAANPPKKIVTPLGLRAPELIFGKPYNESIDIWSFGCLIFELITSRPLFLIPGYDDDQDNDDEHLLELGYILGQIPNDLYCLWSRSSRYFDTNRVQFNSYLEEVPESVDPLSCQGIPLEQYFDSHKPSDMDSAEATAVISLLRRILQYNATRRPTAKDILKDPWLTD